MRICFFKGWFLLLLFAVFPAVMNAADKKQDELARVAILEFNDNTGQSSFTWVKKSLPDAINNSMREHFEFLRTDPGKAQAVADRIRGSAKEYSIPMIEKIAVQSQSDIIIYGNYRYNKADDRMEITAAVYHYDGRKIIGTVAEKSELSNQVFTKIDVISKKIVDHIYKFALALNEEEAREKREANLRLLVLVPSWQNESEKKAALKELDTLKGELGKQYKADFITIYEFYERKKTPAAEKKKVEQMAFARNDAGIVTWLKQNGVPNAFIVLVSDNKVNLKPVVNGESKKTVSYPVGATKEEKAKTIREAVDKSGIQENLQKTKISRKEPVTGRFSLAGGAFGAKTIGISSDKINAGGGVEIQALYRIFPVGPFQLAANSFLQVGSHKHTLSNGEEDFHLTFATALLGPVLIWPITSGLELHLGLQGGVARTKLEKYKYTDVTLNYESTTPAANAQLEIRWQFWRGVFAGFAVGYEHIFYSGSDLKDGFAAILAGYRFP